MRTISVGCTLDLQKYSTPMERVPSTTTLAEAVLEARGTELRMGARGQRATTIEARNSILRHLLHAMEALVFTRLLHAA
eukprot:3525340-Pyramimonas_sp.AAC.1